MVNVGYSHCREPAVTYLSLMSTYLIRFASSPSWLVVVKRADHSAIDIAAQIAPDAW